MCNFSCRSRMAIQCANLFLLVLVAYCVQLGLCSTVALGDSCPATGCTGLNNASCISGGCFCDPGFYQYDDYHCETRIVVGGSCSLTVTDPLQCTDNAHCENTGSLTVCVLDSSPTATPGVQGTHSSQLAASTGTYNSHGPGLAASTVHPGVQGNSQFSAGSINRYIQFTQSRPCSIDRIESVCHGFMGYATLHVR